MSVPPFPSDSPQGERPLSDVQPYRSGAAHRGVDGPEDRTTQSAGGAIRRPIDSRAAGPAHPVAAAALVASLAALATFVIAREQPSPLPPPPPVTSPVKVEPEPIASLKVRRARFFDTSVAPQIEETDRLNRQAAQRCVARLRQVFRGYEQGVDPFVEDLTSLSTRMGIARRMPGDWWGDDGRIERYVRVKFERHLFSQQQVINDIAAALESFRREVDSNQRRMLVQVQASLAESDLPDVSVEQYEPFFAAVARELRGYSSQQGTTSVYNALTVLVLSEAGSYAALTVVAGILARFGTAAAVTAATGVGVTAGATATGAGGGSLAGPVGTAVGLGVGLAVGLVVDWWMTDRFQEEMSQQMVAYLRSVESSVLDGVTPVRDGGADSETLLSTGPPTSGGRGTIDERNGTGLVDALPQLCDRLSVAYRERFYQQLVDLETAS